MKECSGCNKQRRIWKNVIEDGERKRYCQYCWNKKNKKAISPRSAKMKEKDKIYSKEAKKFKQENPFCQANIQGICQRATSDVHHIEGRVGDLYLDKTKWAALCRMCHVYITEHPDFAREIGM